MTQSRDLNRMFLLSLGLRGGRAETEASSRLSTQGSGRQAAWAIPAGWPGWGVCIMPVHEKKQEPARRAGSGELASRSPEWRDGGELRLRGGFGVAVTVAPALVRALG